MKKLLSVLILCLSSALCAQNFAPVDAVWNYKNYRIDTYPNDNINVRVTSDTMIMNKYVTILDVFDNAEYIPEGKIYIHESDGRVYFYEDGGFKLLYDFNLVAGDTLISNIPKNRMYYDFACYNFDASNASEEARVVMSRIDSTSNMTVDGVDLKILHTSGIQESDSVNCITYLDIYERIGSERGFFGEFCTQCLAGFPGYLRCYTDNDIFYKPVTEDCELFNSVAVDLEEDIRVYPNPTSHSIRVEGIGIPANTNFEIHSAFGERILDGKMEGQQIDFSSLPKGIYFLRLQSSESQIRLLKKIIKL